MAEATGASADLVIRHVADMNDREDAYEGPVPHAIQRFARFELVDFDVGEIDDLGDFQFDPRLAAEYAAMDPTTMPPIVIDPVDRRIIDGYHRANAVLLRGGRVLKAYVGVDPDPNWEAYPDEDLPAP